MKRICIITTRHISYNPRVLKEADLFDSKNYQVSVITINNQQQQRKFDEDLMRVRKWKLKTVDFRKGVSSEKKRWLYLSIKQKLFYFLSHFSLGHGITERATNKAFDHLVKLAKNEKADIYIVHHPEALAIGFQAAKYHNSQMAFDAEDFHSGMNESSTPSREEKMISYLEKKYLPSCMYITAASKGIANAYSEKYSVQLPKVILNVFPKVQCSNQKVNDVVKFYWFSQVIGPNRNLEHLLKTAATISQKFEIHLRGSFQDESYKCAIQDLAKNTGVSSKLFFHEPILPEEIIPEAMKYDIGLALESDISINRNICVTNKIFSYLMSGLGIIATDTYGQKDIFKHLKNAGYLCKMNDISSLRKAMLYFIEDKERLFNTKQVARQLAMEEFNWENESKKVMESVAGVLNLNDKTESSIILRS